MKWGKGVGSSWLQWRGVSLTHWEGWNKSYPLIHFKNLNPCVSAINSLTHREFAEGEDVITCRVTSTRTPEELLQWTQKPGFLLTGSLSQGYTLPSPPTKRKE